MSRWPFADAVREVFGLAIRDGEDMLAEFEREFPDVQTPASSHHLNRDRTVAVATDYFWNEDMSTCPTGAKVQLLGAGGVASYGTYNGRDPFWVAWAPVPKRRPSSGQ